jgi:Nucleotidyltransferase
VAENQGPRVASDYAPSCSKLVRQTCVEGATRLGNFRDEMCVVGGLVPSLIVDQSNLAHDVEEHIGTIDLDLGFSVVVLDEHLYEEIAKRLSEAGFSPDTNVEGNRTAQRWRSGEGVTIDFLIPPTAKGDRGGRLRNLEANFAAIITPALDLAFQDFETVVLREMLPGGRGEAEREIKVCGSGAFIVLKALAFDKRGKPKDGYDLFYVLRNHRAGVEKIAESIRMFGRRPEVAEAISILDRDFKSGGLVGPASVADFLGGTDDSLHADVAGIVRELFRAIGE